MMVMLMVSIQEKSINWWLNLLDLLLLDLADGFLMIGVTFDGDDGQSAG